MTTITCTRCGGTGESRWKVGNGPDDGIPVRCGLCKGEGIIAIEENVGGHRRAVGKDEGGKTLFD